MKQDTPTTNTLAAGVGVDADGISMLDIDGVQLADGDSAGAFPRLLQATRTLVDPCAWVAEHRDLVIGAMRVAGAVLLRGFGFLDADMFERLSTSVAGPLMEHREQSVYRNRVQHSVFTSTAYPADQVIFAHNEHSYSLHFPMVLAFWCELPASEGGETTVIDTRKVYRRIGEDICDKFARVGWMYECNVRVGATLADPGAKRAFEEYCAQERMACEWKSPTHVRTTRWRPATIRHPYTDELSWFNHVVFAHPSTLPDAIRSRVLSVYGEDGLPTMTSYGDGSAIEEDTLDALRAAYTAETVAVSWQRGDVLLLDNVAAAHGRNPFTGNRRVLVTLGDPHTRTIA